MLGIVCENCLHGAWCSSVKVLRLNPDVTVQMYLQ